MFQLVKRARLAAGSPSRKERRPAEMALRHLPIDTATF